jgi:hypothetical protein
VTCCRPSCGVAMLVVGGAMASRDLGGSAVDALAAMPLIGWIWLVLLLAIVVLALFVVSWWEEGSSP